MKWSYLFKKEAWSKKEILYQFVHIIIGFSCTYFFYARLSFLTSLLLTIALSVLIEFEQKFRIREDGQTESWKIPDRLRDISFYILGTFLVLLVR